MLNRPSHRAAIPRFQKFHYRVAPFSYSLAEQHAGDNWRDQHGKQQRTEKRKGHGPSHRMEQATLDTLQREDWQVRGNDDRDREEDGTLDFLPPFTTPSQPRLLVLP